MQKMGDKFEMCIRDSCMDGTYSNVGAVVGATYPEMSRILRKLMPNTYFLSLIHIYFPSVISQRI